MRAVTSEIDPAADLVGDVAVRLGQSHLPCVTPPPASRAWRSIDVLRVAMSVIGVYLALQVLWGGRTSLFIALIGVLFGLAARRPSIGWGAHQNAVRGGGVVGDEVPVLGDEDNER